MSTVINNPQPEVVEKKTIIERSDGGAGWGVAVIILIIVIAAGAYLWMRYYRGGYAAAPSGGTNINVTLPAPTSGNTPGTTNPNGY